jgi:hypothetical protein
VKSVIGSSSPTSISHSGSGKDAKSSNIAFIELK